MITPNRNLIRSVLTSIALGVWLVLVLPAWAQTAPAVAPQRIAPLKYRQRTLTNGLMVLSIENHQSPTVAIQVWYHVGGKDDKLDLNKAELVKR